MNAQNDEMIAAWQNVAGGFMMVPTCLFLNSELQMPTKHIFAIILRHCLEQKKPYIQLSELKQQSPNPLALTTALEQLLQYNLITMEPAEGNPGPTYIMLHNPHDFFGTWAALPLHTRAEITAEIRALANRHREFFIKYFEKKLARLNPKSDPVPAKTVGGV
jgi:hypothetical protein